MPSNKVKYFVEKLADAKSGDIQVSVNKKERKVYVTLPENLVSTMMIQYISKVKSLPEFDLPSGKVIKTPFFSYTKEGNAIQTLVAELGGPTFGEIGGAHAFQTAFENLKNGCALVLSAAQMDQLCKLMGLKYGYEDFVFVMDAVGDVLNANSTQMHFRLEDKEELTSVQFVKAFQAKVKGEAFSFLKADARTRLDKELPKIDMDKIKEKAEKSPDSETAQVYEPVNNFV